MGMTTTMKMGRAKMMTIMVPITLRMVPRSPRKLLGMTTSQVSTSLANLVMDSEMVTQIASIPVKNSS